MSDSVYAELVAAGAPELDLAAGEFYSIQEFDTSMMRGIYSVSIRQTNQDRRHWWQAKSYKILSSDVTVTAGERPGETELQMFASACKTAHQRAARRREELAAEKRSRRFIGDHP